MSGGASIKHYWELLDTNGLSSDRPMDTARCWSLLDNLKHAVDVYPCYRINWADKLGYTAPAYQKTTGGTWVGDQFIQMEFPTNVLYPGQYPNYDVRVAALTSTGTVSVTATISNAKASRPTELADPDVIGVLSGSTTSTTGAFVIDGRMYSNGRNVEVVDQIVAGAGIGAASGQQVPTRFGVARLSIVLHNSNLVSNAGYIGVVAIQVREFTN